MVLQSTGWCLHDSYVGRWGCYSRVNEHWELTKCLGQTRIECVVIELSSYLLDMIYS